MLPTNHKIIWHLSFSKLLTNVNELKMSNRKIVAGNILVLLSSTQNAQQQQQQVIYISDNSFQDVTHSILPRVSNIATTQEAIFIARA